MPVPILVWGVGAAATAVLAWKNRQVLKDAAASMKETFDEVSEEVAQREQAYARSEVKKLAAMSPKGATEHISKNARIAHYPSRRYPCAYLLKRLERAGAGDTQLRPVLDFAVKMDRKLSRAEELELQWAGLSDEGRVRWARAAVSGLTKEKAEWMVQETRDGTGEHAIPFQERRDKANEERASCLEKAIDEVL